jgi:hypothetical protein
MKSLTSKKTIREVKPCRIGDGMRLQRHQQHTKIGVVGIILITFGVIGLIFGAFEYSVYSHNKETVEWNEALGHYNQHDRDLVRFQGTATAVAFGIGALMLVLGGAILVSAESHNRRLDTIEIVKAMKDDHGLPSSMRGTREFCEQCGVRVFSTDRFCRSCGKRFQ